jgi:hypothetical protein
MQQGLSLLSFNPKERIMADKVIEVLLEALKQAMAESVEQRLYKSGKLDGLFASRTGLNGEAADVAIRDGLLEIVRTEAKGKIAIEWVRATPRAAEFLQQHESPVQVLKDLQAILQTNRQSIPLWLAEMQRELDTLAKRIGEEAEKWTHRLESLGEQVAQALRRIEAAESPTPESGATNSTWAVDALGYLDRRRGNGVQGDCPLPELFGALRPRYQELSLPEFHDGLRRLQDRRALRLLPFAGSPSEMPEPEYALIDGNNVLYFAAR